MTKQIVVIVDAYSSGNLLATEFKSRGYTCVHVQSTPQIPPLLVSSFRQEDFDSHFVVTSSIDEILFQLKQLSPIAVITGSETGVALADFLSDALELKTNGTELSHCRRNKYDMSERIRSRSLEAVRQVKANSFAKILKWIGSESPLGPWVVKPMASAASDGVFLCQNLQDLEKTFSVLCGAINKLDLPNDEILVQEYLVGPEFVVDTVSCRGAHYVTDIWESRKLPTFQGHGSSFLYDYQELLSAHSELSQTLTEYTFNVLTALGIHYGPAHAEVILTSRGPVLVEVGARLAGTNIPKTVSECTDQNPIALTVDAYCNEEQFFLKTKKPYVIRNYGRLIYLHNKQKGIMRKFSALEKIQALPSFDKIRMRSQIGDHVTPTIDLYTVAGILELKNSVEEILIKDHALVQELQKNGLFEVVHG